MLMQSRNIDTLARKHLVCISNVLPFNVFSHLKVRSRLESLKGDFANVFQLWVCAERSFAGSLWWRARLFRLSSLLRRIQRTQLKRVVWCECTNYSMLEIWKHLPVNAGKSHSILGSFVIWKSHALVYVSAIAYLRVSDCLSYSTGWSCQCLYACFKD